MNQAGERSLWDMLEKKLEEIAGSLGYFEEPVESLEYQKFDAAWTEYLESLGIERCEPDWHRTATSNDYSMQDPLYPSGKWLRIPREVMDKIMVIGLP